MGKSKVGGILSIVSGAFGFFNLAWMLFLVFMMRAIFNQATGPGADAPPAEFFSFLAVFYSGLGLFFALLGILGIVGGIFAIKKKRWALALAGAIAASITFFPCGIAAIIFVSMAQPEFATRDEGSELPG